MTLTASVFVTSLTTWFPGGSTTLTTSVFVTSFASPTKWSSGGWEASMPAKSGRAGRKFLRNRTDRDCDRAIIDAGICMPCDLSDSLESRDE